MEIGQPWSRALQEMLEEAAVLRREVREWSCPDCPVVLPLRPAPGELRVTCPNCGQTALPRGEMERRRLARTISDLRRALADMERQRDDERARTRRALEVFLGSGWILRRGGDVDETLSGVLDQASGERASSGDSSFGSSPPPAGAGSSTFFSGCFPKVDS